MKEVDAMDIKKAIEYAQVSFKKMQEENRKLKKLPTAKQLGEIMWLTYQTYDNTEIHLKAQNIINDLELKKQ